MQVRDAMTKHAQYLSPDASVMEAARKMAELDCGFLPVHDGQEKKLAGVITDRDITLRSVAKGNNPETTVVRELVSSPVMYCYEDDDIDKAAESMRKQGIYRLVVLDNPENKQLAGILSLGDIYRKNGGGVASDTASDILKLNR